MGELEEGKPAGGLRHAIPIGLNRVCEQGTKFPSEKWKIDD